MPLSAEHAMDGVNEEEAICGGLITKVIRKKGRSTEHELTVLGSERASTLKGCCARLFQGPQDLNVYRMVYDNGLSVQ